MRKRRPRKLVLKEDQSFPIRLKRALEFTGMSRIELSRRTGIPASTLSGIESGIVKPSFQDFREICYGLEIDSEFLIGRDEIIIHKKAICIFRWNGEQVSELEWERRCKRRERERRNS